MQKSAEELDLEASGFNHAAIFPVNAITAGLNYDILQSRAGRVAVGAQGSVYFSDKRLNNLYGKHPMSTEVFIRLYPPRMNTTPVKM